jgi:hypothetical protein
MLVALLAVLGVDLVVIVVLLAGVLGRRRWVRRQPDVFPGAIRVSGGEVDGLGAKWTRGYGRWVRDVLVWTKALFLVRNVLVPTDELRGERRPGPADRVRRLGDEPVVAAFACGGSAPVEIAARGEDSMLLRGPYRQHEPLTR